jgi:hypothetical protein
MSAVSMIDRVFSQATVSPSIFSDTFLDFLYNIRTTISGDARPPVTRDGNIFIQMDAQINAGLASVTRSCNLDSTTEAWFVWLLRENHTLENIFKQAALGTPVTPTGLSVPNLAIAQAINKWYIPTATEACESLQGKSFDDVIDKFTQLIEGNWLKSEWLWIDWKKGIALFQWGGDKMTTEEYTAQQRKLLQDELARQWFSPRMAQTILSNFDCTKSKAKDDSASESVRALNRCFSNPIIGIEEFDLRPWFQAVEASRTTDERVYNVNALGTQQVLLESIMRTYTQSAMYQTPIIDTKSAIMNNLIELHLKLLFTAQAVEKRIDPMYANCMRTQSSIPCPRP